MMDKQSQNIPCIHTSRFAYPPVLGDGRMPLCCKHNTTGCVNEEVAVIVLHVLM